MVLNNLDTRTVKTIEIENGNEIGKRLSWTGMDLTTGMDCFTSVD